MKKIFNIEISNLQIVNKRINQAALAGFISGAIHTALSVAYVVNPGIPYANPFSAMDALIMFALSYGVSCRNRVCVTALFIYFLIGNVLALVAYWQFPNGIAFILLFIFFQGVRATFVYHRLQKATLTYA